jgi:hypothetical protein
MNAAQFSFVKCTLNLVFTTSEHQLESKLELALVAGG